MPRTLYAKLALALFALLVGLGLAFVLLLVFAADMYQQEVAQKLNRGLAQQILDEQIVLSGGQLDASRLDGLFHTLMVINPSVELYLLDKQGNIQGYSAPPGKVKRKKVDIEPIRNFVQGTDRLPLLGDDPRAAQRRKAFSAAAVRVDGELRGYLYIILGGERYQSVAQMLQGSYIATFAVWAVLGGTVLALAAGLMLFRLLTSRLRGLETEVAVFRDSGFERTPRIEPRSGRGDEIDRLCEAFDELAKRIVDQLARLRQTDALRRELVANVSHDLRTPLAALHGYLETLSLKYDTLDSGERREYVGVALQQAQRLNQLVEELFELAKLDSSEARPVLEPFSLPELAHDIVQKFQLQAREKEIELEMRCDAEIPFVAADIGLIERVLDNLLKNALSYTPRGGTVTMELRPAGDRVTVCVADTGYGVSEKDLPNIFGRFYRADPSRQQTPGSSGLGLAIAKRILELHGRSIHARRRTKAGTLFAFQLPVYRSAVSAN